MKPSRKRTILGTRRPRPCDAEETTMDAVNVYTHEVIRFELIILYCIIFGFFNLFFFVTHHFDYY